MTASVTNQVDSQALNNNTGPTTPSGDAQTASLLLQVKEALSTAQASGSGDEQAKLQQEIQSVEQQLKNPNLTLAQRQEIENEIATLISQQTQSMNSGQSDLKYYPVDDDQFKSMMHG